MGRERILIAGGGIAGLTLGAALSRVGLDAELVERDTEWRTVGAGIAVQPNGVRVLRQLGLGPALEKAGASIHRWLFRDQDGAVLCDIELSAVWGDVGDFIGIDRARLQEMLRSKADVSCRLGTWVTSLSQTEYGVSVEFSNGTRGEYGLVVGADGIRSTVRQAVLGTTSPVYGGQMAWRSLAPIRPTGVEGVEFWLGDGCFFGLCPVGDGRTYGFGNVTQPQIHDPLPEGSSVCVNASRRSAGQFVNTWRRWNRTSRFTADRSSGWRWSAGMSVASSSSATRHTRALR